MEWTRYLQTDAPSAKSSFIEREKKKRSFYKEVCNEESLKLKMNLQIEYPIEVIINYTNSVEIE